MSGAPIIKGTSQLPKNPIRIGITIKKIIIKACAVTITLYNWSLHNNLPGWPNSSRIKILKLVPIIPDHTPTNKYKVPISLWLHEPYHFSALIFYKKEIINYLKFDKFIFLVKLNF